MISQSDLTLITKASANTVTNIRRALAGQGRGGGEGGEEAQQEIAKQSVVTLYTEGGLKDLF